MASTEKDYEKASVAAQQSPRRDFNGYDNWDRYWFEDLRQFELYYAPSYRHRDVLDLTRTGARQVVLNCQPRKSADPRMKRMGNLAVRVPSEAESLKVITGALEQPFEMRVDDFPDGCALVLEAGGREGDEPPSLRVGGASLSAVSVDGVDCVLTNGEIRTATISNSLVRLSAVPERIEARGDCLIELPARRVRHLQVAHGTRLRFAGPRRNDVILPSRKAPELLARTFEVDPQEDDSTGQVTIAKGHRLDVSRIYRSGVRIEQDARLDVGFEAIDLEVTGPGTFAAQRSALRVAFATEHSEAARLELAPWAIAQDISGQIVLGTSVQSQINGLEDEGLTIKSIDSPTSANEPASTAGILVRNFRIPINLPGLQTIAALTSTAAVAVPLVTPDLPGQRSERLGELSLLGRTKRRFKHFCTGFVEIKSTEHTKADYSAALARLAERRGAPGSVRTKLAWLEYRMRQSTTTGRTEWLMLGAYRPLGYGERAGPPFALYGALASAFTVLGLMLTRSPDLSIGGVGNVLTYWLEWISAPLHVLRLADRNELPLGPSGWAFAGRVVLAVPFITGVLALRNYVKRAPAE